LTKDKVLKLTSFCLYLYYFSAGVGRTGTYIALDHLMQFINEHDFDVEIDIFDLVLKLRENRQHMVQTEVGGL
jgi:cadherin 5 type 2 (VE-cadherin)